MQLGRSNTCDAHAQDTQQQMVASIPPMLRLAHHGGVRTQHLAGDLP
jgi:hypothetical protein